MRGKKHFIYEAPYYYQHVADLLAQGVITPSAYVHKFLEIDKAHSGNTSPAHIKDITLKAQVTANLIIRAHESGIKVEFVDSEIDQRDKTNPHPGCGSGRTVANAAI